MVTSPKQPSDGAAARAGHGDDAGLGRRLEDGQDLAGKNLDHIEEVAEAIEGGDEDRNSCSCPC